MLSREESVWEGMDRLEDRSMLAAIFWDGGGGDLSWHNPMNWSGDAVPAAVDDVTINVPGSTPTITHAQNVATSVHSLTCNEPFALSAGTIAVGTFWRQNYPMTMSGGAITGAGNLELNGSLTWTGGSMTGAGKLQILPTRTLFLNGNVTLGRMLVNNGAVNWTTGNIAMTGATIHNLATRVFNAISLGTISGVSGTNLFINAGELRRNGPPSSTSRIAIPVNNPGLVDVRQGTLTITGSVAQLSGTTLSGGAWKVNELGGGMLNLPGTITTIGGSASVWLNGASSKFPALNTLATNYGILILQGSRNLSLSPVGGVFTNAAGASLLKVGSGTSIVPGTVKLNNSGTVSVSSGILKVTGGGVLGGEIELETGGSLAFSGVAATVTGSISGSGPVSILGPVYWTAGRWEGSGGVAVAAGGTLTLSGAGTKVLSRYTTNEGTVVWAAGPWQLDGITLTNSGTMRLTGAGSVGTTGTASLVINNGAVIKSGAGVFTFQAAGGGVRLENHNSVQVEGGRLIMSGGGNTGGSFVVSAGADVALGGLDATMTGATISGAGTFTIANVTTWRGGMIQAGGLMTVSGAGTFNIAYGGTTLNRNITIAGRLNWTSGTLATGPITFTNTGMTTISVSGGLTQPSGMATFNNSGLLTKTGYNTTSFTNANLRLNNTGTVHVSMGQLNVDGLNVAQISGNTLTGGTWRMTEGGTLNLQDVTIKSNQATLYLSGYGSALPALWALEYNSGTVEITTGCQVQLTPGSGTLVNQGVTTLGAGAYVRIDGNLSMGGSSVLNVQIAGLSSGYFGFLDVRGNAYAGGRLVGQFVNSYNPPLNAGFVFVAAWGGGGSFSQTYATGLSAGKTVAFEIIDGGARLVVVSG